MTGNGQSSLSKPTPISVAMIVRNCAKDLDRCLGSVNGHANEIVIADTEPGGSTDGTREVAQKYGAKLVDFPWINDFSAARNFVASQCSSDAVMWLDSDDVVENADLLFKTAGGLLLKQIDCLYVRYDYEFDASGHCTTRLWRERVTDRNVFQWKAPIHECQCAAYRFEAAHVKPEYGVIKHTRQREDQNAASVRLVRNLEHLEQAHASGKMETRLLFYWGNTLVGLGRHQEAIEKYAAYVQNSGVPEERYAAMMAISECHRTMGENQHALRAIMQAVCFRPDLCSAYLHAAETYIATNNYADAERWAREALEHLKNVHGEMVYNPKAVEGRPHVLLSIALANLGRLDEALPHMEIAERFYPDDENVKHVKEQLGRIHRRKTLVTGVENLARALKEEGRTERLDLLSRSVPDFIQGDGYVQSLRARVRDPSQHTIAFYCPVIGEAWNPHSIKRGIGGSEEAVINMAREMKARAWNVEVYCEVDQPGDYGPYGHWYPLGAFKGTEDDLDVAVWWRNPESPIHTGVKATCSYAWLHDTPVGSQWIPNYDDMIDRVMFLSQYHRSLYPWVKEEHVWYTANATDPSLWHEPRNEPGKLIYSSCPSRGLLYLLQWWDYLKDQVRKATLDVYYGWNVWAINRANTDPVFGSMYREIEKIRHKPGVTWHGRVGQDELAEAMARSQIWAYPCDFPEISCITGMKAQIHGVLPITIAGENAVHETVQYGDKIDLKAGGHKIADLVGQKIFMDRVVHHLKHPDEFSAKRGEMIAWAREKYRWGLVADDWDNVMRLDLTRKLSQERRICVQKGKAPRRAAATSTA